MKKVIGKTVSRSVYQKLSEENKKLKSDLKAICFDEFSAITIIIKASWKMHFKKEADFNKMMKKYATNYFKEHPEYDIALNNKKL